jgi:hypothetical protein
MVNMKHIKGCAVALNRWSLIAAAMVCLIPTAARAGLLDDLKKASRTTEQNPVQVSLLSEPQGGGSLSGALGATSVNTDFPTCMAQTSGVMENLRAQVLRRKLALASSLSPQERQNIEADAAWLEATAHGARIPAPDPKNSQRYFVEMSDAEQQEVSGAYNRYAADVRDKCEYQYGGMSQFGDPSGRAAHAPINTHVAIPDLFHAAPPVEAAKPAVPSHKAQFQNCTTAIMALRWKIFGDHMEQKMKASALSSQERKEWAEDLVAVRTAQNGDGMTQPKSPGSNPSRYIMRLTPQEQMTVNQEFATQSQQMTMNCMSSATGQAALPGGTVTDARSQELAEMHERRRAERASGKTADLAAANADAQAWLAARPFKLRPYTAGSSTQANYLKESGVLECLDRQKGFRAHETLAKLTTKRGTVASQDRQELEAWISAWGAVEAAGKDDPAPVNNNAQGYLKFLANVDQQEINAACSTLHNAIASECESIDFMEIGAKNSKVKYGN